MNRPPQPHAENRCKRAPGPPPDWYNRTGPTAETGDSFRYRTHTPPATNLATIREWNHRHPAAAEEGRHGGMGKTLATLATFRHFGSLTVA